MTNTPETMTFEGLAPRREVVSLTSYAGFTWTDFDAFDKHWTQANGYGKDNGVFRTAIGQADAVTLDHNGTSDGMFSSTTPFTLKSGYFALAWGDAQGPVTISAIKNGETVDSMVVNLTTTPSLLTFGASFRHIDAVEVSFVNTSGPTDANVVMDNVKVVFAGPIPPLESAPLDSADSHWAMAPHLGAHDFLL